MNIPRLDQRKSSVKNRRLRIVQTILLSSISDIPAEEEMPTRSLDTILNPLVDVEHLQHTISYHDGISAALELSLRYQTALLTQSAGILLKLPQETIAQAIVIQQRFYVGGGSYKRHSLQVRQFYKSQARLKHCRISRQHLFTLYQSFLFILKPREHFLTFTLTLLL